MLSSLFQHCFLWFCFTASSHIASAFLQLQLRGTQLFVWPLAPLVLLVLCCASYFFTASRHTASALLLFQSLHMLLVLLLLTQLLHFCSHNCFIYFSARAFCANCLISLPAKHACKYKLINNCWLSSHNALPMSLSSNCLLVKFINLYLLASCPAAYHNCHKITLQLLHKFNRAIVLSLSQLSKTCPAIARKILSNRLTSLSQLFS